MSEKINENEDNDEELMTDKQTASIPDEEIQEEALSETEFTVEGLKETIIRLQSEVDTNLDGWQRSRAEFDNYRRRTQQQLSSSKEQGAMDAFSKILPVIDDFERAFDNIPEDLIENPWISGTSFILKNIQKVLDEFNIEVIDPLGEEFDPTMHEAIGMEDSSEYESGIVSTTLQKGYKNGDKILRPALVRVAS